MDEARRRRRDPVNASRSTILGGAGDDLLKGGTGSDMYVWAAGDGLDRIVDAEGADDAIYFSSELNREDLRVVRISGTNDLMLHFGDSSQGMILTGQWGSRGAAVEQLHFVAEDGSTPATSPACAPKRTTIRAQSQRRSAPQSPHTNVSKEPEWA